MTRRIGLRALPLVLALSGTLAILTMHGASAHELVVGDFAESSVAALAAHPSPMHTSAGTSARDDVTAVMAHRDGAGDQSDACQSRDDGSVCALIVISAETSDLVATPVGGQVAPQVSRPTLRTWTPDPPIPRLVRRLHRLSN